MVTSTFTCAHVDSNVLIVGYARLHAKGSSHDTIRRTVGVTDLCQSLQEEGKGSGDLHVLQ